MNIRGFSGFNVIATLVIGLLLVAILSALFPNLLFGWFRNYQNLTHQVVTPGTIKFTPYTPVLSEQQQRLEASIGLLVTGIESVGANFISDQNFYREYACTENRDLCMTCDLENENLGLWCTIKGFELPQQIDNAESWMAGYGDPLYLLYYEKFPPGEEKTWQFETSKLAVAGLVVQGVFTALPFSGALKAVHLNHLQKLTNTLSRLEAAVDPQTKARLAKKALKYADQLRDAGKLDDSLEALTRAVVHGERALAAETVVDDFALGIQRSLDEMWHLSYGIDEAFLKAELQALVTKMNLPLQNVDELAVDIATVARSGGIRSIDDIKSILIDYNLDEIGLNIFKAVGPASALGKSALKKVGFKKIVRAIAKEGTVAKQLEKSYEGLSQLRRTNPELYRRIIKDVDDFVGNEFVERQIIDGVEVLVPRFDRLGASSGDAIEILLKGAAEKPQAVDGIRDLFTTDFGSRLFRETGELALGPAPGASASGKFIGFFKEKGRSLGCLAAPITLAGGVTATGLTLGASLKGAVAVNKAVISQCNAFVRAHYVPLLLGLGYLAKKIDSENQKFIPVGEDSLALVKPLEEGPTLHRTLANTDGYFIATTRDSTQTPTRFFLASPCKVDLKIENRYCKGKVTDGSYLMVYTNKFGQEIHQPIEPVPISKEKTRTYHAWDTWNAERRAAFLRGTDQGDPWYAKIFKESTDEIFYRLVQSPEDLKIALKFVYTVYPGASKISFQKALNTAAMTTSSMSLDTPSEYLDRVCAADELFFGDDGVINRNDVKISQWETSHHQIMTELPGVLGNHNQCYTDFIDALVDFSLEHPYGDPTEMSFTCSATQKTLTMKGAYARHYLHELIGRFDGQHESDVQGNSCGFRSFNDRDGVAATLTGDSYEQWVNTHLSERDWNSFNTWDAWENYIAQGNFPLSSAMIYESGFFNALAQEAAYTINYVSKEDVAALKAKEGNIDPVVKTLNLEETEVALQPPTEQNIWVGEDLYTTVPCITITPDISPYTDWNEGNNYCYTGRSLSLEIAEDATLYASIVSSIALIVLTQGAASPYVLMAVGTVDVTNFASTLILSQCGKWPVHAPDLKGCFS